MQLRRPRAVLAGATLAFVAIVGAVVAAAVLPAQPGLAASPGAAAGSGHYQGFGDAGGFLNILPPGQEGTLTTAELQQSAAATSAGDPSAYPPHVADQRSMYDALNFATSITDSTLSSYYKDASFGVRPGDIARVYHPTRDVTVIRDKSFGVPHIFGKTRAATMFAEGYTTAEDRLLTMDVLRRVGRGTVAELVGPQGLAIDKGTIRDSPYNETDLQAQIDALSRSGAEGRQTVADFRGYVAGINAYLAAAAKDPDHLLPAEYKVLGQTPAPWKLTDIVATAANIGAIFGRGGGHELANSCGLATMTTTLGGDATKAQQVFDAVHLAASPAAPTTSSRTADYPTGLGTPDPAAVPTLDSASLQAAGGAAGPSGAAASSGSGGLGTGTGSIGTLAPLVDELLTAVRDGTVPPTSNAILIDGRHTATGRPIAVFGPQVGYQMPSFLVEKDVHGPGIDARGVGFAGVDAYVLLGRGRDYAWSATSSGADNTDTFVLRLCDPTGARPTVSSTGYEHDGKCKAIQTFDHTERPATIGGGTGAPVTWTVQRAPDYGPVIRRGTLTDGTPIAIAEKRSTYGDEISSAIGFRRLNDPEVMKAGYPAFRTAAGAHIGFTFNWFYVDGVTIGYQHSCKCPLRARGVDPDLPTWGTGKWDWTGYLAAARQPFDVNPAKGYITSWNNKQAPGFRASDAQFSYGTVQRVQLLNLGIAKAFKAKAKSGLTARLDVVTLMMNAATLDLRGVEVLPQLLSLLTPGTEPANVDPRALDLRERLEIWATATDGPHRHGKTRGAPYTDPVAVAAMDAWWPRLTAAIFGPAAGSPYDALGVPVDDSPRGHGGSSFDEGSYSAVTTDLSVVLGKPVAGAWSKAFCGGGSVDACRTLVWQSLGATVGALDQQFHSANVDDWRRVPADDEIRFQQIVVGMLPMEWQNRPTFQQVVQLRSRGVAGATSDAGGGGGALTIGIAAAVGIGVAAFALWWTRRRLAAAATKR